MPRPETFPHLRDKEKVILQRFIPRIPEPAKWTIDFRYPIPPEQVPKELTGSERDMWYALHQKRTEALVETPSEILIIEVKERLNSLALGQLLNYRDLYRQFFPTTKKIRLLCVAETDDPLVSPSLRAAGIEIVLV